MPGRLGRQYDHSSHIDPNRIVCVPPDPRDYRDLLEFRYFGERGREIVSVVLKNPSSANINKADATVRRVQEYVYRHFPRCGTLRILNLFAYRATDPDCVSCQIGQVGCNRVVGPNNDQALQAAFRDSACIIVAWGGNKSIPIACYRRRIEHVKGLLEPYQTRLKQVVKSGGTASNNFPLHGLWWRYESGPHCYSLASADIGRRTRTCRNPECPAAAPPAPATA